MVAHDYPEAETADRIATISHLLRWRATHQPDQLGYSFLTDGEIDDVRLTYADLDLRARAIATELRRTGAADGQRAVLLLPPGPDFLAALFGCFYAGTMAVPAYPPDPLRLERTLPRLLAIVRDAAPAVALTTSPMLAYAAQLSAQVAGAEPDLGALRWCAVDDVPAAAAAEWTPPAGDGASTALLQYTSGSTAAPRGVLLSHANLLHNSGLIQRFFGATVDSRGMAWLPPYHDMGLIGGLLQPLYGGFPIWLMSPQDFLRQPLRWLQALSRFRVTISGGPNFAYDLCVRKTTPDQRADLDLSAWRVAFNGAEPIRAETMTRFAEAFAPAGFRAEAFLPCYGLAEATLIVSGGSFPSAAGDVDRSALARGEVVPVPAPARPLVSCGYGAADQRIAIVDPLTRVECPPEQVGEIWVAGPSVAQGYWRRPEESREVFRARIAGTGEGPFLRTGDLGFLRDGELVVTGRHRDLIIVRGRNHYPHDLELAAERAHPALRPGCAAAFLLEQEGEEVLTLVLEVAPRAGEVEVTQIAGQVRQAVAEQHELQVGLVVLLPAGAMPKTSSGKVQRRLCRAQLLAGSLSELGRSAGSTGGADRVADPAADDATVTAAQVRAAPAGQRRALLVSYLRGRTVAAGAVAASDLTPDRPLVAVGLDSLSAQQLAQAVEEGLGLDLPVPEILAGASLAEVADRLADQLDAGAARPTPPREPPAAAPSGAQPGAAAGTTPVTAPLAYGQRPLWFLHQLAPGSAAYTTAAAVRLTGQLDRLALRRACQTLVSRHPALRTTFHPRDGEPAQVVYPPGDAADWATYHESDIDADVLAERLATDAHQPFDLATGPLLRMHVYRHADDDHTVLVAAHHLVTDFSSMTVLGEELVSAYTAHAGGQPADLPAPGATYLDLVTWQDELLRGPAGPALARYWDAQLRGGIPPLRLPGSGSGDRSRRGGSHTFRLSAELTERLRQRAADERVTRYVLLLAAYQALLHRYTGQDDLTVGTPLAARTNRALARVVGYCMNPVLMRSRVTAGCTFRDLLERTRADVIGALAHQDYPAALLAERHAATLHDRGLYQTMFVFNQPAAADAAGPAALLLGHPGIRRPFGGLSAESVALAYRESALDLEVSMSEIDQVLHGTIRFRSACFDDATATALAEQFRALLEEVASDPGRRLGAWRASEPDQARMATWNATDQDYDTSVCVPQLFERQAARTPDAVAVEAGDRRLSYRELNQRANRLAHLLRESGVGPDQRVGVYLERCPELLVALLGVLKAGGAYVPVDPLSPPGRVAATLADAGAGLVLTQRSLADSAPAGGARVLLLDEAAARLDRYPATDPAPVASAGHAAYVIYTSGSTGAPKGVEVPHRALSNYIQFAGQEYGIGPADRVLQFSSVGFDASAEEIYATLTRGAALVLRTDRMLASPARFFAECQARGITVLGVATSFWHDLVDGLVRDQVAVPESIRLVVIGGEQAVPDRVAAWHQRVGRRARLYNTYGPTEATIVATRAELTPADPPGEVPIGRPVGNVRAYLLNPEQQMVPVGVVGELYLGGAGVARGYLGQPTLTAQRFVPDPFGPPGARLYRTGDLARYRGDGTLAFVGRADRQVKLSGYRVELGEVEAVLRRHPTVAEAVVVPYGEPARLVAYLVAAGGAKPGADALRTALRATLPEYMVPARYVVLPALPRTPSGKVDHTALPDPAAAPPDAALPDTAPGSDPGSGPADPPRTPQERALARVWAEVLELPEAEIGRQDDFFARGGHSLLATKVLARVNDTLGVDLPLRAVFESPTLAGLAARLAEAPRAPVTVVPRARRDAPLPLSFAQEQIWFLQHFEPGSTNYNVPRALRVHGEVDPDLLAAVLADLEERHEILRTTFPDIDGDPVQQIHEPRGIPLSVLDRRDLPAGERDKFLREFILSAGQEPFDLATGPLVRVTLVRLASDEYVLVVIEHHLVHDGWAQGVFLRDFLELYEARATGRAASLPELPIQYADFAAWQRDTLRGERLEELLDFWRQHLVGAPPVLELPTDRPRPRVLTSRGDQEILTIDGELADKLRELGRDHGASLFMAMFAAFGVLLYGYSGERDIVIGTGIANRQRPELEHLLGMIINTVPLRADLSGEPSFRHLLERTRELCLAAYVHQDMPLEKLVERLRPPRSLSHMPLFQVMFSFLDTPMPELRVPGLSFEVLDAHNRSAKFDLNVVVVPDAGRRFGQPDPGGGPAGPDSVAVLAEYNADLFDAATIRRMCDRYQDLLRAVIADPDRSIEAHLADVGLPSHLAPVESAAPGGAR